VVVVPTFRIKNARGSIGSDDPCTIYDPIIRRYVETFHANCFYDAILKMWPSSYNHFVFVPADPRNSASQRLYLFENDCPIIVEKMSD
jgi:hypothetical protein